MKLFRDYAILAAGQVIGKVAGFVAFAWLARALGPADYGAVEYVVGLAFVFGAVVEGGFGVVGVRRVAHAPELLPVLAAQIPWVRLVLAVISIPAMLLFAMLLGHRDVPLTLVALFALSLLTIPWRQDWLLQVRERMADAAWVQLLRAIAFAVLVLLWVRGPGSIAWVGVAEIASAMLATVYCVIVQHRRVLPVTLRRPVRGGTRLLMREGLVVGTGTIVFTLQQYAPLFLAPAVVGAEATAWFAAAARIVTALHVFSFLYHYSLYPAVARALRTGRETLRPLLAASFRLTMWLGVLAALALALVAEPIVRFTFGAAMAPASSALSVLVWSLPVVVCSGHARWALAAAGDQTAVLKAQLGCLLATVVVAFVAGKAFGAAGLACAGVVGLAVLWGVMHGYARSRGLPVPAPALALLPLAVAAIVGALTIALDVEGWWRLGGAAAFACLAPLLDRRLVGSTLTLAAVKADTRGVAAR